MMVLQISFQIHFQMREQVTLMLLDADFTLKVFLVSNMEHLQPLFIFKIV